jgi:uncharacterized protein (TIGR01777 family)
MRVAISGAGGLIGGHLAMHLSACGYHVQRLVRDRAAAHATDVYWSPGTGELDAALGGVAAVVHLAGENMAASRWTVARKATLRSSRIDATRRLCESLIRLSPPPRVLVAASAIGYYGDRGDKVLTETSPPGAGFLADLAQAWEAATASARHAGIRVVNLRLGVVLTRDGGALARMLTPFRLGLGGPLGSGRQYVSWISLADVLRVIEHALRTPEVSGPVNAVAPTPVTSAEFARTLGRVLRRPAFLRVPAWVIRLAFGEMGRELLLGGARVSPDRLVASGFAFTHPRLADALRTELRRPGS